MHLLGPVPYETVPAFLQHADVVIVPHHVNAFTESLDPIKAYECVAAGRPTVATPVAGFRQLGPPVRTAEGDGFVAAVSAALAEGPSTESGPGSEPGPEMWRRHRSRPGTIGLAPWPTSSIGCATRAVPLTGEVRA